MALPLVAVALLVAPRGLAERRREHLLGGVRARRRISRRTTFAVAAAVGGAVAATSGAGALIAAAILATTITVRVRRVRADGAWTTESAHLLEALETVIGELRVGAHPSAAALTAAHETAGDAARGFAIAAARGRLGGRAADGLRSPDSVVATELGRVADAWLVADDHGLALAELLTAARTDLTGRIRFRTRTTAALAGPRATATVLAGLPLLGIGLGQLMGANPIAVLFGQGVGTVLLPLGVGLACAGLLWTDAITRKVLR